VSEPVRILIADDQALVRGGLRMILDAQPDLEVVGEAADGREALQRARERVQQAGVEMRLVRGDVTDLRAAGIGSGFRLVLDTGTFHDLNDTHRAAMGREVGAITVSDATVLLLVWPKRRRPLIRGVDRSEVEAAFPGWKVTDVTPSHFRLPKIVDLLLRPDEHWYRLRRE